MSGNGKTSSGSTDTPVKEFDQLVIRETVAIRCVGTRSVDIDELVPFQGELKRLSKPHREKLRWSIERKGFLFPLFVWPQGGRQYLLDGHQRLKVLQLMREDGWKVPPVPVVDIPARDRKEAREKLLLISSRYGVIDPEGMSWYLEDSDISIAEMGELTEFPELDLLELIPKAESVDDDEPVEAAPAVCARGDLWALGAHRLLCGSATDPLAVARVLDGRHVFLMVTDPPYGVSYSPVWRQEYDPRWKYRTGEVTNDARHSWADAYKLAKADVAYVWHADKFAGDLFLDLTAARYEIRAQIIWRKQAIIFGRGHYHFQHEPCWYATSKGKSAKWNGGRKQSTIWEIPNVHRTQGTTDDGVTEHGTQKPVECMARPIRNHGGPDDLVYDPFAGSGTTLIAAEREGRVSALIELEPTYCDIVIERYRKWCLANGRSADIRCLGHAEVSP